MTNQVAKQVEALGTACHAFADSHGAKLVARFEQNARPVLQWTQFLSQSQLTGHADELVHAVLPTLRESAACAGLGLCRPALALMRSQLDILLSWLYYKDHPIEWQHVNQTGEGFRLKKQLLDYLSEFLPGFGQRFGILKEQRTRAAEDPYRLLSAHLHSQSAAVLPAMLTLAECVSDVGIMTQCVDLEAQIAEYVSDVLICVYGADWAAVPIDISNAVGARFKTPAQRNTFFESFGGG